MVIEKFAAAFSHSLIAAFQRSLTTKNNAALTMMVAPSRHAKSVRRQMMRDSKLRVCSAALFPSWPDMPVRNIVKNNPPAASRRIDIKQRNLEFMGNSPG